MEGGLAQPRGRRINGNKGGGHIKNTIKIDNRIGAWKLSPSAKIKKLLILVVAKGGGTKKVKKRGGGVWTKIKYGKNKVWTR